MVRSRRTPAGNVGGTQNVDDVGMIVYRDHGKRVMEDFESSPGGSALPLSIDHADIDDNDLVQDDGDSSDGDDDDDDDILRQPHNNHHPAYYTPHLFLTHPHLAVLPVLLLEFLSLALTRAVLPSLLLKRYGSQTYIVMGMAECVRGVLAFFACPLFGKLSDVWGRRPCLLVTVLGTLAPVCSLAFWEVVPDDIIESSSSSSLGDTRSIMDEFEGDAILDGVDAGEASDGSWYASFGASSENIRFSIMDDLVPSMHRIDVFVILLALSGMFSSTFTLTFAYISDVVKDRDGRVAAFGLALATFGLSFTIGPLLGGYLANVDDTGKGQGGRNNWMNMFHMGDDNDDSTEEFGESNHHSRSSNSDIHPLGQHRVFFTSLILALLDLFYIHFFLPESLNSKREELEHDTSMDGRDNGDDDSETHDNDNPSSSHMAATSGASNAHPAGVGVSRRASSSWWNPWDSVRYLTTDPLLSTIGRVTFLYYTALHAVVSTLVLYAARQFHLGPQRLGELMAALGLSTMISEAVLVRIAIPLLGETRCMRIGLISFAIQCLVLAVADSPWHLFACAFLAMVGNLVYPSISSLVSSTVRPEDVGRALGAVNGVKSLTEGVGPLLFGTLLTMSEKDKFPGWPYFLAAIMVALAYQAGRALPDDSENYTSEVYMKTRSSRTGRREEEAFALLDSMEDQNNNER